MSVSLRNPSNRKPKKGRSKKNQKPSASPYLGWLLNFLQRRVRHRKDLRRRRVKGQESKGEQDEEAFFVFLLLLLVLVLVLHFPSTFYDLFCEGHG
jgi:hypothetical protein